MYIYNIHYICNCIYICIYYIYIGFNYLCYGVWMMFLHQSALHFLVLSLNGGVSPNLREIFGDRPDEPLCSLEAPRLSMMLWAFASGPDKRSPWCHKVDADRPDRKDDLPSVEICFDHFRPHQQILIQEVAKQLMDEALSAMLAASDRCVVCLFDFCPLYLRCCFLCAPACL